MIKKNLRTNVEIQQRECASNEKKSIFMLIYTAKLDRISVVDDDNGDDDEEKHSEKENIYKIIVDRNIINRFLLRCPMLTYILFSCWRIHRSPSLSYVNIDHHLPLFASHSNNHWQLRSRTIQSTILFD